jgi:hypothetical protein
MRTYLRAALAAALLALPAAAPAQLWQARANMTPAEFQAAYDELTPRGFVPYEISAFGDGGDVRFAGVWRHEPAVAWEARSDLTGEQLQRLFDEFTPRGYVPTQLTGYATPAGLRFAAVWRREPDVVWEARFGMDAAALQENYDRFTPRGYVPAVVSAYAVDGQPRFAAVWRRRPGVTWEARSHLTEAEYQAYFDRFAPQGYVPTEITVYEADGATRFAAVWERVSGTRWEARHGLSLQEHAETTRRRAQEGYAPYVIAAYARGGEVAYAGAWRFAPQPTVRVDAAAGRDMDYVPQGTRAVTLPIAPVVQQTQVWCWLAVGEMVLGHYGIRNVNPGGNFQCGIIGAISGPGSPCATNCFACIRPSGSNYATVEMLSTYARVVADRTLRYSEAGAISPARVMENIDARRPVVAGVSYTTRVAQADAQHAVLIVGYDLRGGEMSLVVNDPFPYPQGQNPYLRHGGTRLATAQYRIPYRAFRDQVFWHWSVFNIEL